MNKSKRIKIRPSNKEKTLQEVIILSRLRRALQADGSLLQRREEVYAERLYDFLLTAPTIKIPEAFALLSEEERFEKPSLEDAVTWFRKKYPQEALPLVRKLRRPSKTLKTIVQYGLKKRKDFSNFKYINVISEYLRIPLEDAFTVWESIYVPYNERSDARSRLVKKVVS